MKALAFAVALASVAQGAAPADRYFGHFKMSTLRIRYEIAQVKAHYESHKLLPNDALHLALLTEQSFDDWRSQYPQDSWLPSTGYNLAVLYGELPGPTATAHAKALYEYVVTTFPATSYATRSRSALHRGIAVRPMPAWANAPTPTASPSATSSASPSASTAPSPSPSARGSPFP